MNILAEKLGLPQSNYGLHQAIVKGLPVELATRLADELNLDSSTVAGWIGTDPKVSIMTPAEGDAFCRLTSLVDVLMNVLESDQVAAIRWLTSPNMALGDVPPVSLLSSEVGGRAARQVLLAIEYGLPV